MLQKVSWCVMGSQKVSWCVMGSQKVFASQKVFELGYVLGSVLGSVLECETVWEEVTHH